MDLKPREKISVRGLVEYALQCGDITSGFMGSSRLVEGTRGHQAIQRTRPEGYLSEVPVSYIYEGASLELEVSGRIDGILPIENGVVLEEIKTTLQPVDMIDRPNFLHLAQAECYGFIYAVQNFLPNIIIKIVYYNIDSGEVKCFEENYQIYELEEFFNGLAAEYLEWAALLYDWRNIRNASIKQLAFPFNQYRKGQHEFAVAVYRTVRDKKQLFAQAPTGTGKTIATIFPALKAMGENIASKLFYLTAKTITGTIAESALGKMTESGLRCKAITLTAKEKICFNPSPSGTGRCDPIHCKYAIGYYDRLKEALKDIFSIDTYTRAVIEEYSRKYSLCPFEFSLDLSVVCDCIICDYNYVFDPRASLKRFFQEKESDYVFLIDEAHNLVDRAREMFSAEIYKKEVLELKRLARMSFPQSKHKLPQLLNKINSYLVQSGKLCSKEKNCNLSKNVPSELLSLLRQFTSVAEEWLTRSGPSDFYQALLSFYFEALFFIKISELYDEDYITYAERADRDLKLKLFCLDPSRLLGEALKRGGSAILFSATMTPLDYFSNILGGTEDSYKIRLPSPFPRENLCILMDDSISTRYRARDKTYGRIAASIADIVGARQGNYLVFFPSYQYMNEVYSLFSEYYPQYKTIFQKSGMAEDEKEAFLNAFSKSPEENVTGFAVMGGMFGEGIDLTGDRLLGCVIVGVGLPQICLERDLIRNHFDHAQGKFSGGINTRGKGFEWAYVYPGMNKVLQAVGRVIRSENDRGVVLLIDDRFSAPLYRKLFPVEWDPVPKICTGETGKKLINTVRSFWGSAD